MEELNASRIRNFRLHSHHLDREYHVEDIKEAAGACGMQNTPPGAWETALYNRIPGCDMKRMERLLNQEKTLLQAWSLRGAPVVFPVSESDVFLSALIPENREPWIYTGGISLALDFLKMDFNELLSLMKQVTGRLDDEIMTSKNELDQTLAEWMIPLLPEEKKLLWNQPSIYGEPERQTVGGAVVSFLLRPCSFSGLVVFGERGRTSPSFTSCKNWTGSSVETGKEAVEKLVRKFLHCYGPATVDHFIKWLGCSPEQGRRMWGKVSAEMEAVTVSGKKCFVLSEDRERLFTMEACQRDLLLLGGHDPYLDQRDRDIILPDRTLHRQIWKTVKNPGAVLFRGEIIGFWDSWKKGAGLEIKMSLWEQKQEKKRLSDLAERYAAFRQEELTGITMD